MMKLQISTKYRYKKSNVFLSILILLYKFQKIVLAIREVLIILSSVTSQIYIQTEIVLKQVYEFMLFFEIAYFFRKILFQCCNKIIQHFLFLQNVHSLCVVIFPTQISNFPVSQSAIPLKFLKNIFQKISNNNNQQLNPKIMLSQPDFKDQNLTSNYTQLEQKIQQDNIHRRLRITLAVLTAIICSFTVNRITQYNLNHSRNLHRTVNYYVLDHTDLDIYWYGFREGQYLINYPIHEYYELQQFSQFLQNMQQFSQNFNNYTIGYFNQDQFNTKIQHILVQYQDGTYISYQWNINQGLVEPFTSNDTETIKGVLIKCLTMEIQILGLTIQENSQPNSPSSQFDLFFIIKPFSHTSIFVTTFLQQKQSLATKHIPHFILGIGTLMLVFYELKQREQRRKLKKMKIDEQISLYTFWTYISKFKSSDVPDFIIIFCLLYTSFASFTNMFTLDYIVIMDGFTCLISWLYFLKFQTQNDDYYISMLIKKSYIFVGRMFISFFPLFIGFVLFASTVFCRYTNIFDSFHKSFISLFCVCFYNMIYQQYRTTSRANPISTIFFTSLVIIFTICIYSGMLVAVFCSYMWNKRQDKIKQQLMSSLKIQCANCNTKYNYAQGYQQSVRKSLIRRVSNLIDQQNMHELHSLMRQDYKQKKSMIEQKMYELLKQNEQILSNFQKQGIESTIQQQYCQNLKQYIQKIVNVQKQLSSQL